MGSSLTSGAGTGDDGTDSLAPFFHFLENSDILSPNVNRNRGVGDDVERPALFGRVEHAGSDQPIMEFIRQPWLADLASMSKTISEIAYKHGLEAGAYWTSTLADCDAVPYPELPPSVSVPTINATSQHSISLPTEISKSIFSSLIYGTWAIVAGLHTNTVDIVFGVASHPPSTSSRVSWLINKRVINPLRINVSGTQPTLIYLQNIQQQLREMVPVDLDWISGLSESYQHVCNFQTLLDLTEESNDTQNNSRTSCNTMENDILTRYPLVLKFHISKNTLEIVTKFDSRVIDPWRVRKILRQFEHIIQQLAIANKKHILTDISTLMPDDRMDLKKWNKAAPITISKCMHEIIQEHSHNNPKSPAVCAWDGLLSYGELEDLSTKFAQQLAEQGVGPECIVPLCFEKSLWVVVAIFAVLKAGGGFLLLDPLNPKDRLAMLCSKVSARVALASELSKSKLENCKLDIVIVNEETSNRIPSHLFMPLTAARPDNAACVVFTSGSTGEPKGCILDHQALSSGVMGLSSGLGLSHASRFSQISSYSFVAAMMEVFMPLFPGGCTCILSEEQRLTSVESSLHSMKVNAMFLTPSRLKMFDPKLFPSSVIIGLGGEPVQPSQFKKWKNQARLRQIYGSSETSAAICIKEIDPYRSDGSLNRSITCRYWIVDPDNSDRLIPLGSPGELIIEGPIVGRTYINDPIKTSEAFIPPPPWRKQFGPFSAGSRFYKSGDLAQFEDGGHIQLLGRKDMQIKLRGQRIEPGEIEYQAKLSCIDVKEVVVELVKPQKGTLHEAMLMGFFVLNDQEDKEKAQELNGSNTLRIKSAIRAMRERLESMLPRYMIPSVFVPLSDIPKTPSGKISRKGLREMGASYSDKEFAEYHCGTPEMKLQPLTEQQRKLQYLWSRVLNIQNEKIGLNDSFFHLGGDSMSAMRLSGEARQLGIELNVAEIFRRPRLQDMSELQKTFSLDSDPAVLEFSLLPANTDIPTLVEDLAQRLNLDQELITDAYPCTSLQQGLLSLSAKQHGDYVSQFVLEMAPEVLIDSLRTAWEVVHQSCSILRTMIVQHDRYGLLQVVSKKPISWETPSDLVTYLKCSRNRPMDLDQSLSHYAMIQDPEKRRSWFVLTIHHALFDGVSMPQIFDMVANAYHGNQLKKRNGFNRYIRYVQDQDHEKVDSYWKRVLSTCESTPFPEALDKELTGNLDQNIESRAFSLPMHDQADFTLSTRIRAAWAIVASRHTCSEDVVFGATVTGRNTPVTGIEEIIGPTIATVPVRVRVHEDQTLHTFLDSIQRQAVEMIPYEHVGLSHISKLSQDSRHACKFNTLVVVQPRSPNEEIKSPLGAWLAPKNLLPFTTYPLLLECFMSETEVDFLARHDPKVFKNCQIESIMDQFVFLLEQMFTTDPEKILADIDTLTLTDKEQVWSYPRPPQEADTCIHKIIKDCAQTQLDEPAICAWDGEVSYRELIALTEMLGNYLAELGVGPHVLVPLCFEKSKWAIIAMLAVHKAGGAFVPIDASQAASRRDLLFKQCHGQIILTSDHYSSISVEPGYRVIAVGPDMVKKLPMRQKNEPSSLNMLRSPAYVIFTSGSTGTPKGVVVEHVSLATGCISHGVRMNFDRTFRVLQFSAYTFDASIMEIFTTLMHGGCVCVPSEVDRTGNLGNAIVSMRVNVLILTPSVSRILEPAEIPSIKLLMLAGEPMRDSDYERWKNATLIMNGYGPTECTVCCSIGTVNESNPAANNIGSAVGCALWVVDSRNHQRLMPIGSVGELLVEGPIVARGYLNDSTKTANAFIQDPIWLLRGTSNHPGRAGRLYKTGDLVRYKQDGNLEFIGRKDTQVKIRGQRVELGEVERHVKECSTQFEQVAAEIITPPGEGSRPVLVAFVQLGALDCEAQLKVKPLGNSQPFSLAFLPSDVEIDLRDRLPDYMVPVAFLVLEKFPLVTTGKTDRKRLREIGESFTVQDLTVHNPHHQGSKRLPTTKTERTLRDIWARTLNMDPANIGIDDNFFALGGDSITAMQLSSAARAVGINIPTRDILREKSIDRLLRVEKYFLPAGHSIQKEAMNQPFPLSPMQEFYFQTQRHEEVCFDQCFLLKCTSTIKAEAVDSAITKLVDRHSMLRARFSNDETRQWMQRITDDTRGSYHFTTLENASKESMSREIMRSRERVNIEKGPLFVAALFDHDQGQSLFLTIHHLLVDLVTWRILLGELEELITKDHLVLDPSTTFYTWRDAQASYAAKHLNPQIAVPFDLIPPLLSYWGMSHEDSLLADHVETLSFELDSMLSASLTGNLNDSLNTRPVEIIVGALLHCFSLIFDDRPLPTIFSEAHGREVWDDTIDLSRTVGWFTALYPVHILTSEANDLINAIRNTRDIIRSLPLSGSSYFASKFLNDEGKEAFSGGFPAEIHVNYLGQLQQLEREDALFKQEPLPADSYPRTVSKVRRFALIDVVVKVVEGKMVVMVTYDKSMQHRGKIACWVKEYEDALKRLAR